jgi:radical SAM protein with 4Fe4S-binding SPASM domain
MNLFVTYACNLRCPYCFARALRKIHPRRLSAENFEKFFAWCVRAKVSSLAFIGGEPTLHPLLAEMIGRLAKAAVTVSLFTNGLGHPPLLEKLSRSVENFIINYNPPELLSPGQRRLLHDNLLLLRSRGARLTFSKNFSPSHADYAYLLEGITRYGVSAVRYDISRPDLYGSNEHASPETSAFLLSSITDFAEKCARLGVSAGLDCCLRLCDLKAEQRTFLERTSAKFTGICHPSLDIHPDLSVSYCLPLHDLRIPDITAFSGEEALRWHFAEAARSVRGQGAAEECFSCKDFMRRCQGGCMAQNGGISSGARPPYPRQRGAAPLETRL